MDAIIILMGSASGWREEVSREVWYTDQPMRSASMPWNIPTMSPIFMPRFYISLAWMAVRSKFLAIRRIERDYGQVISEILA
jgi:hypothetical protein